jgi:hypothetical protein
MTSSQHVYEIRPRKDHRGVDLISDALPFGGLWYTKPDDAVDYAKFFSRSHHAVIRVYDDAGNVIETREHAGEFREPVNALFVGLPSRRLLRTLPSMAPEIDDKLPF